MKVLLDTNVVLDVLLIREPFAQMAMNLFDAAANKEIESILTDKVMLQFIKNLLFNRCSPKHKKFY